MRAMMVVLVLLLVGSTASAGTQSRCYASGFRLAVEQHKAVRPVIGLSMAFGAGAAAELPEERGAAHCTRGRSTIDAERQGARRQTEPSRRPISGLVRAWRVAPRRARRARRQAQDPAWDSPQSSSPTGPAGDCGASSLPPVAMAAQSHLDARRRDGKPVVQAFTADVGHLNANRPKAVVCGVVRQGDGGAI